MINELDFCLCQCEQFCIKFLHYNKSLLITKPDKGVSVMVLDYNDYVNKIMAIIKLGPDKTYDRTKSIKLNI